jgi:Arylsulfotransferase (ASST)
VALLALALALPALTGPAARAASSVPPAPSITVAPASSLRVIPFPGTPDAAPSSQVIFSALRPSDLVSVHVQGSRSGSHTGHLSLLPADAGTAFVPDQPFVAGELVKVSAQLASSAAAAASGAPGASSLDFSFRVEVPLSEAPAAPLARSPRATASAPTATAASAHQTTGRTQSFHSQDNFHPTVVNATSDPDTSSGDIFLNPNNAPQVGSMIINSKGQLVWFRRVTQSATFNLEVQHYQGQPVLTWWHGNVFEGHGINGQDVIMNRHYQILRTLHAGNGYSSDLHEFQLTSQGTAWIDDYVPVKANLSSVGGPSNGSVIDCVIQELSIKTGQVLWEWHALGHIPISDSHNRPPGGSHPFDYLHCNSIQQEPNDNILVSARNTWGVYLIGEKRGHLIWQLGGKHSSFHMGQGTGFEYQHDARQIGETVTVFDDAAAPQQESQSSGKAITINRGAMTATLRNRVDHSPPLLAGAMGSFQTLPNNNSFVGWGTQPDFSEFDSKGNQIFNGSFPPGTTSYRAYRFKWGGVPLTPPSLANQPQANGDVDVWASWNGATGVGSWRVLGGRTPGSLHPFATGHMTGFETKLVIQSEPRYVAVQALGFQGHVIHTSHAHAVKPHLSIFGPSAFVASDGAAALPVGCFTGHDCHISVKVNWGSRVAAQSSAQSVRSRTGALLHFQLSSTVMKALKSASHHRTRVLVSVHDAAGAGASKHMELILYRDRGAGPARQAKNSPTIQIARTTGFVSSSGAGQLLAACYGPVPCHPQATVSSGGTVIATTKQEHVGAEELANVYFKLTSAGQTMLSHATGNQLAAKVKLTNSNDTATGQVALVRYR